MDTNSDKSIVTDNERLNEGEKQSAFIKCEGCGSNMVFDPETQSLKCEHCGRVDSFKKDDEVDELDIENAFEQSKKWNDDVNVYRCSNCGAVFTIRADEVSVKCPYCSTTHIVKSDDLAGIVPNAIYPFRLTHSAAAGCARKWAKRRVFAPRKFKKTLEENNLNGFYLPAFTFDSNTHSYYDGRIGKRKTRTVRTSKGTRTETYIEWRHVSGTFDKFFDDITVSSGRTAQSDLNRILPCEAQSITVYKKEFLSGYSAEHYSRDVKTCWNDAKTVIDKQLRTDILNSYGYDVIDYLNVNTRHDDVTYKYLMIPVYRLNYVYKKKSYNVTVNGSTGKVAGKTPVSPIRVIVAVLLGLALLFGLAFLFTKADCADSDYDDYDYYGYNDLPKSAICLSEDFVYPVSEAGVLPDNGCIALFGGGALKL